MRVAVVGAGAMGGVWAARIAVGAEAALVDVAAPVVEAIRADGLRIRSGEETESFRLRATSDPTEVGPVDVVFIFVKAQHTVGAAALARPLVGDDTTVVSMQNGWGNADVLAGTYPAERLVIGVTYHSATVLGPGQVAHTGRGPSFVGPYQDGAPLDRARAVADLLTVGGIETTLTAEVKTEVWKKLILNAATLPTAALTRLCAGDLGQPGPMLDLVDALAAEATRVAQAQGYAIEEAERLERIHTVLRGAGRGKASMLQDVEAGRKTEIEVINAAVVRAAERLGLDVPLNRAMVALLGGLERSLLQ